MPGDWSSREYRRKSLVQQGAAEKLIRLLALRGTESVLDVGCGPGNVTSMLAGRTSGRVVGVDPSDAMIREARSRFADIEFRLIAAEDLDYNGDFDVVFCNSALQWFTDPAGSVDGMFRALRSAGRLALACPGSEHFAPFFERVVAEAASRARFAPTFARWSSPWFFLPDEAAYREVFEGHGLRTVHISIDHESGEYSVDEAYGVYATGAAMGYASPDAYEGGVSSEYIAAFNEAVREEMAELASEGRVVVDFNRLYYLGEKA